MRTKNKSRQQNAIIIESKKISSNFNSAAADENGTGGAGFGGSIRGNASTRFSGTNVGGNSQANQ